MALRVYILLAAFILMVNNCRCITRDEFLEDYYNRLFFQYYLRPTEKRSQYEYKANDNSNYTDLSNVTATNPMTGGVPDIYEKRDNKRTLNDFFDTPNLEQKIIDHYIGATKNGMWPCYCKYFV